MSIQIFQHLFPDGRTLTLSVDMSKIPIAMVATPLGLAIKHPDEYERWVKEVVTPALMEAADVETLAWFAKAGLKKLV